MSNLFSKLERDFYFSSSDPSRINDELQTTLKNEVGLVQGARSSKKVIDSNMEKGESRAGSEAKVIQMESFLFKTKQKLDKKSQEDNTKDLLGPEDSRKLKQESMNLFRRFCFQHGIIQHVDESGDSAFGRHHTGGNHEKKGSQPVGADDGAGARESKAHTGTSGRKSRKKLKSEDVKAKGGGGGKRPNHMSSSSEPDPFFSSTTATASEDNEPSRTSTDVNTTSAPSPSEKTHHVKKRHKLQSVEVNELTETVDDEDEEMTKKLSSKKAEHDGSPTKGRKSRIHRKSKKSKRKTEGDVDTGESEVDKGASFSIQFMDIENEKSKEEVKNTTKKVSARKPRKSRKIVDAKRHAKSEAFSIGSLTHHEIARRLHKQRDSEWLEWSSTEEEVDESSLEKMVNPSVKMKERPIQTELRAFMDSTSFLDRINSILGLDPYVKIVRSNQCVQVKWVPWSGKYIGVCLNALVFFTITLSIFCSLITILEYDTPLSSTRKIIKIDFVNHLIESLFLMLLTLFITIWTVSCILEMGTHYAEFYTRFNMGLCLIKYDATNGIHEMIAKHLGCIFMFELLLLLLFFQGYAHTSSIVRESCGFLGYTILRLFNVDLRESIYYPLVELWGLVVFLYCFLCVNVVLLQLAVVAKALGNMAKEFNLRMGYAFGTLSLQQDDDSSKSKHFRKAIPFKKLLAEHQIITSLFRNIGQVDSIVFGAFLFTMICEIVLVMWLFFDVFLEDHPPYLEGVSIDKSGFVELAVPLRLQKKEGERLMKAFVIFAITWLMYWIFGGVLHNAGDACLHGMEFVRRYGLTLCKNSKQRRFILSMINSFSPKNPYWIGQKFQFSRATFVALTSFVIGASMVTISFRPDRLSLTSIELCNENGYCHVIQVYKMAQHVLYSTLDAEPPRPIPVQPIGVLPPTDPPWETEILRYNSFLESTPCTSLGTYPLILSAVAGTVYTEWSSPYSQLSLPFLYKKKTVADSSASPPKEYILFDTQTIYMSSGLVEPLTDCYGKSISNPPEMDDCKNPSFVTPKRDDLTVKVPAPPEKQLIAVNQIPGYPKSESRFFCCYKYGISLDNEVKVCNMPSKTAIDSNCSLSAVKSPSISPFINKLEAKRATDGTRDDLASEVSYSDPIRILWTNCFCKESVTECNKALILTSPTTLPPPTSRPGTTSTHRPNPIPGPIVTKPSPTGSTSKPKPPAGSPSCFHLPDTPDDRKYFTKCTVKTPSGDWAQIPVILYPTIFQQEMRFKVQKLPIMDGCIPPPNMHLPVGTSAILNPSNMIDCKADSYSHFVDECNNPILYSDTGVKTRWSKKFVIRVVIWDYKRLVCCVDYQLKDSLQSRRQALVCNNHKEFISKCGIERDNFRKNLTHVYFRKFKELAKNQAKQMKFESDEMVVACMCQPVPYVQLKYTWVNPNDPAYVDDCENSIKKF